MKERIKNEICILLHKEKELEKKQLWERLELFFKTNLLSDCLNELCRQGAIEEDIRVEDSGEIYYIFKKNRLKG